MKRDLSKSRKNDNGEIEETDEPYNLGPVNIAELRNVYEHVIGTGDDIVDIINNQAAAGESAVVGPGTHLISQYLSPPDNFRLSILGEIKLDAESNTRIISRGGGPKNIVIDGHGVGSLNGNKDNQTFSGTRWDHECIWLKADDTEVVEDCAVQNLEIHDILAGAAVNIGGPDVGVNGLKRAKRCLVENVYIHNCGDPAQNAECDGVFHQARDHTTRGCIVHDVSDTPYAMNSPLNALLTGCVAFETGDQQMARCATAFPKGAYSSAMIVGNHFSNGSARCITTFNSASYSVDLLVANNYIGSGFSHGVDDENGNSGDFVVVNNHLSLSTDNSTTGIIVDGAGFASVRGNIVETGQNQISFRNMDNIVCMGNVTRGGTGGIVWHENDGNVHKNAIISGNYCENHSNRDVLAQANMQNYVITNNILKSATAIEDSGTSKVIKDNLGYQALVTGTATVSGDSTNGVKTFNIGLHGLAEDPTTRSDIYADATAVSADAVAGAPVDCYPVDGDADGTFEDLEIKFASAPPDGADNVTVRWTARLATKTWS